jgi:hypothetical protein
MSGFAQVQCRLGSNGVILRTFEVVKGPFDTVSHLEKERFHLKPGSNEVPVEFFDDWTKANPDHDLVKNKYIERI